MLSRLIVGVLAGVAVTPALAHGGGPAPESPAVAARITLVTGDTVELTPAQAGRYAATVDPAPGRERITFHTLEVDGGLRVVPSDAVPLIAAGRLDTDLFDVQRLIADGYGDATSPTLPLIVRGGTGAAQRGAQALSSINATAVAPAKDALADFWRGQTGARLASPSTIFLDGKVRATLDRSAAQIGAPQAWQRGLDGHGVKVAVLDTGIDATHPDLAGKVVEARNFSTSADTVDHFGHGTHVAATIAGTGQASGGSRKGIAYGADLLVGKVLGDDGVGFESQIIEGMQWAAGSGAKVVNMSLGGDPTDGLDPMSLAVDELSRQSGTLFVVAAGNAGGTATVGSPGAAREALTVGAVDRADQLADFSSRGPRLGDQGLKPELTAPGVDIVAARAAGTTMGNPVDTYYTAASGTSMATPHVAGAAAILAQEHPDWTGAALKNALVSTAQTTPNLPVYAQGAGRVDVARATGQEVTGTGVADFGLHTVGGPTDGTRTVAYTNGGNSPVSLALTAPAAVKLSAAAVIVPAHGTATVDATVDFETLPLGTLSGWITATATGGVRVTTAVGAVKDGPVHRVTVRALDRTGKPTAVPVLTLMGDDARSDVLGWVPDGGATYEVHEGTYLLHALIEDGARSDEQATLTAIPELKVDRDVEVLVDARKGTPIRIETPRPAEQRAVLSYYVHRVTGSGRDIAHGVMHFSNVRQVNVAPTKPVRAGSFEFSSRWQLVAPMVRASVGGPVDLNLMGNSPAWAGTRTFALAKSGDRDVRGKAVLIPPDDQDELVKIDAAARAGAAVALVVRPPDFSTWTSWSPDGERLPVVSLVLDEATADTIARRANRTLSLTLTTSSPYLYDVIQVSPGRIPESIVHKVTPANSMRITSSYADNGGFDWVREQRFGWRPWQTYAWNDVSRDVRTPSVREEWVSAGDSLWQHYVADDYPWLFGPLASGFREAPRSYRAGHSATTWAAPVVRPTDLGSNRTGDVLHLRVPALVDHDGHYAHIATDQVDATLWRNGGVVAELPDGWQDVTTTPGDAAYRLRVTTAHGGEDWTLGTRTATEWTFRSGKAGDLPLLTVDYDVREKGVALRFPTALRTLRVDVSTDDGVRWRQATVRDGTALVSRGRTPVSLRVRATDRAGNTVDQTVIRAYGRD
ncbi:subtilisin family serine protease [Asanoa ferruginea]|uniref:Subtilisin family serine protease n=1 Tax=Asanoa ferruginea TaxID=53367 RepID=A0A3D9ZS39_9ACTN|nr:S8 family serine peptidase [Asanoa ferruginea]REF99947.1 subtilisin family serine protease [Asanoa ferruginea]GIF53167.1 peptidase [Asanoa ferruginea]